MLIRILPPSAVPSSEITPEPAYYSRRDILARMGLGTAALLASGCGEAAAPAVPPAAPAPGAGLKIAKRSEQAGGETQTPFETTSTYNNYYEFGTDKGDPARNAHTLRTRPWSVAVEGECEAPGRIDLDGLIKPHALEERVYRHRCVEAWSIVVPWVGFPLAELLKRFKPTSKAKYVAFETLYDKEQMPLARWSGLELPYKEGLRIDEAMHPLAFVSVGMYGKILPNQNGAPLRLILPWKYGYKSIKSVVRIRFTERAPVTTWNQMAPNEYGFYSNVNPDVDHPRWSQASERRLGELFKRKTLPYNGYPEVASLYTGMDPKKLY
ncbi:protein-methionine-sulfoxide reductase catalytic subunit MsrP [Solimonas sp. K1W22B-7]|uniref:protein-methionine-sulfoxide reductase catalytic subunit MsrP n=1 Tax=Solimonas sp. K1W22B-7 TaxID=2303331 RepID=UPI000E32F036|nr:protein-methionine-sulfoxide reductase catalytic subunit MsrP [Solimonas sp. K1W22B-7]AXQ27301.1 protein-methionine-sulfoxide reductase catalytic subunit MsrP [Solimonas sp. K1W22B-7]